MNLTNLTLSVPHGPISCGDKFDYEAMRLCQRNDVSNIVVFGSFWLLFFVTTILHNRGKISDEQFIRLVKLYILGYIFSGTIALGGMIAAYF